MLTTANFSVIGSKETRPFKLLVRPQPLPQEAALGYLIRLTQSNGFSTPRQLWLAMQGRQGVIFFDELMDMVGLSGKQKELLLGPVPHYWQFNGKLISGLCIKDYNHHYMRWCPLCFRESLHLHGIWGLKLQCVCLEHRIMLVDRCHICGAIQRLERNNIERCLC